MPALQLEAHEELVALASRVRRITPVVSLEPPQAVLLEVGGSLKLWGGIDAIKHALRKELDRRRLTAHLCAAPTVLAALWLARGGREDVLSGQQLAGRLGALPLAVTGWPDATRLLLEKMGIRTVGDCLRLPREGLVRRVGKRYLDDLDKSLGQPDSRAEFCPDQRFSSIVEFHGEVTEPEAIANAGRKLIGRLADALHKHQAQITSCRYGFHHLRRPATVTCINLVMPTYESKKITDLFLSRLEILTLPAPVTALSLTTGKSEPMVVLNSALFPESPAAAAGPLATNVGEVSGLGELIARLRIRFSAEDIYGLALAEDHRPEAAWSRSQGVRAGSAAAVADSPGCPRRPLWLLPAPVEVASAGGNRKPLRLKSGPERIEAGWWEGRDTRRDYYVASGTKGERLWVYRDRYCNRDGWYLHGIFG